MNNNNNNIIIFIAKFSDSRLNVPDKLFTSPFGLIRFQIVFEATRSFTVLGDIAIDDVVFVGCGLPGKPVV